MKSIFAIAALAAASVLPAHAALTTNQAAVSVNVIDFEAFDGLTTTGPEAVAANVTFTGAAGSILGANMADLGDNGAWGFGNYFVGNDAGGELRFTFSGMTQNAGAFLNHYSTAPAEGSLVISAYDSNNQLLESHTITIDTAFESYGEGQFFGISRNTADIRSITFAGTGVVLDNFGFTTPVPEPETYAMLLAGLGLLGTMARRRRAQ